MEIPRSRRGVCGRQFGEQGRSVVRSPSPRSWFWVDHEGSLLERGVVECEVVSFAILSDFLCTMSPANFALTRRRKSRCLSLPGNEWDLMSQNMEKKWQLRGVLGLVPGGGATDMLSNPTLRKAPLRSGLDLPDRSGAGETPKTGNTQEQMEAVREEEEERNPQGK